MCLTWGDKLTEDEMNGTSSTHVTGEVCAKFQFKSLKGETSL